VIIMGKWALIVGSTLGHIALLVWLDRIEAKTQSELTSFEMFEAAPEKAPEVPPPTAVVPEPEVKPMARAKTMAAAEEAKAPEPAAVPSLDALPDFGLELGGESGGSGGFAVRQGTGARNLPQKLSAPKQLTASNDLLPNAADPCQEAAAKPKLVNLPQPAYTEAARAAGIEGKVRLSITVDATGQVANVEVLQSLGHGLDEAALAAARAARFEAALRCGKPTSSTFTVSMRFSAN
jgi:periplasmic protein TonB